MFPDIFQICIVIPELVIYIPFNILAIGHIFRADLSNISFYSLQNTVEIQCSNG